MDFVFKVQWLRETVLPASRVFCRDCSTPMLPPWTDTHVATAELPQLCSLAGLLGFFFLFYQECRNLLLLDGSEMSFRL